MITTSRFVSTVERGKREAMNEEGDQKREAREKKIFR